MKHNVLAIGLVLMTATTTPASIHADPLIQNITLSTNSVAVSYPVDAHFLGIFPMHVGATVTVTSEGRIGIHYPWWSFLLSVERAEVATKIAAIGDTVRSFHISSFSEDQQVAVLTLIHSALQSSLTASAHSAASTTSGSVQQFFR